MTHIPIPLSEQLNESTWLWIVEMCNRLLEIEELEGKSQGIWDDAISNLAYGNLTLEMADGYVKKTYKATELHAQAMELLRDTESQIRHRLSRPKP